MDDEMTKKSYVQTNVWFPADHPARPPLLPFCQADSVHCLLMISGGDSQEFCMLVGWYDYDKKEFNVMANGVNLLKQFDFKVTHWMIVPSPTGKVF